jgi:hypothetical protein
MKHPGQVSRGRSFSSHVGAVTLAVAVAVLAACGSMHRGSGQPPALLYFTNESLDQADVYAVLPGNQPTRIGTVFAGRTDTLKIPADIAARGDNINIVARLLARSARPSSGPVAIHPGDHLIVRLPVDQKLLVVLPATE